MHRPQRPKQPSTFHSKVIEGRIAHHGRFAFLLSERGGEDLMLRGPSLRLAMDGDRVEARLTPGDKGRPVGEIVKVLERAHTTVTGVLKKTGEHWTAVPEEADERDAIRVIGFAAGLAPRAGEVVLVKITQWPTLKDAAGGEVVEALGLPTDPGVRMRAVLRTRDLPEGFPEPVLAESRAFPSEVSASMWLGRMDLRATPIFTIDGADAKDFDDAVSLEVINPHIMRLGVHIADVSHYVKKGTALDSQAAERATSIYLADRVVPMLPPNLSDHLCSLMPNVDRLTLSCFMDVDERGNVRDFSLKETVIRSRRRFTYEEVELILKGERVENVDVQVNESVLKMGTLFKALNLKRMRRGALDMTVPEYKVVVDAAGRPVEVVKRPRLASHRLIEEFMLLANETVASALLHRRMPFLSRIHPEPDTRKLETLGAELKKMGVFAPTTLGTSPSTAMQIVLNKAVGQPLEDTINMLVMRSLKQASYSYIAGGHFGLASKAYCHFTSPIRRYPDLITHRAVKALLQERKGEHHAEELKSLGEHCSERERVAADAERRSVDILRAELLKRKVGQTFEGVVSGSAGFGIFVTLKDLGASGLVRGGNAALGARVGVTLDSVDEGKGELTLSLIAPNKPAPAGGSSAYAPKPGAAPEKPRWDPNPKSRFNPNKPRYKPDPSSKEKPRSAGDKPKWDPSKPRFDKSKRRFDPSKPRFDSSKPKWDPNKPKYDANKPKWGQPKPKFGQPKPKFGQPKPKFFGKFSKKRPGR